MTPTRTLGVVSDIHYAGPAERARGNDFELRAIRQPLLRGLARGYRRHVWMRQPLDQGYLLDRFLEQAADLDYLVANGDFSCNTGGLGVCDEAAFQSVSDCLGKLRAVFGTRLRVVYGDHELGKLSLFGSRGGMRFESFRRAREGLGLDPFWQLRLGHYVLMGVVSSLISLPVFLRDVLPEELGAWETTRQEHLAEIVAAFSALAPSDRVLLFCHDPTALPFLARLESLRARQHQIERTIIGHLHSRWVFRLSRLLAGMPRIHFLGHAARKFSSALREARCWRDFHVQLCPALAGIELERHGGYLQAELPTRSASPVRFNVVPVPRGGSRVSVNAPVTSALP